MRQRLAKWMMGRNGMDALNRLLSVLTLIVLIVSMFVHGYAARILWSLAVLGLIVIYFRMLSRNVYRRQQENGAYLRQRYKVTSTGLLTAGISGTSTAFSNVRRAGRVCACRAARAGSTSSAANAARPSSGKPEVRMFGYVIANLEGLTQAQKDRYKGCYCGLCRVLKQQHGFSGRMTLTYDMTFLVLLLSALYEADEERGMEICPAHPLRKHFYWQTRYTAYAADMNVVLAYNNCRDDWQDDGSALKYWEAEALSRQCAAVRARRPRQCAAIEQCMAELSEIEQADTGDLDAAANCFGRLMGELFVTDELWDDRLRPFGEALGRFIYLLDAVIDLPEDLRHGRYNPLRTLPQDADLHALLTMLLGECSAAFEALPVLQDVELLRNILYSGVWLRYEAAMKKRKIGRSAE